MRSYFRQSMAWLHTWGSLVIGWLLFFVFVTGTAAFFDNEIGRWMTPERPLSSLLTQAPQGEQAERALEFLILRAPTAREWDIKLPHPRNQPDSDASTDYLVAGGFHFDPSSGREILPPEMRETRGGAAFEEIHHQLHYVGRLTGIYLVGFAAMLGLISVVSGVIVHKKIFRDFFTFRPAKGQRSWLDAHNVTGVMALPFVVMILYTGLVYFYHEYFPLPFKLTASAESVIAKPPKSWPPLVRPQVPMARLIEQAETILGKGQIGQIRIARDDSGALVVDVSRPWGSEVPRTQNSGTHIRFNALTGERLPFTEEDGPGLKTLRALISFHEAWYANYPLRWLYFISGLLGCVMIATGMVLWVIKRRERHAREGSAGDFGLNLVARLNVGVLAGLPVGVAAYFWANRLLPLAIVDRADWELDCLFVVWAWVILFGALRPERRAWVEVLTLGALAFGLIPLLNALTTDRHLGITLPAQDWGLAGFDLTMFGLAAIFGATAWRLGRKWSKTKPLSAMPPGVA